MIPTAIAFFVLAQMTAADWAGWAALATIIAKVFADWITRVQDRLLAESKAKIILDELKAQEIRVRIEAVLRESRIVSKIDENTAVNVEQIRISNGFNEKIKSAVESVAEVAKVVAKADPTQFLPTDLSTDAIDRSTVAIDKNSVILEEVVVVLQDQTKTDQ